MTNNSEVLTKFSSNDICQKLSEYLTDNRKQRIEDVIHARLNKLDVALEAVHDLHNAAAVVRSCEVFGVQNLHIIAAEGDAVKSKGVTQGAFGWIDIHRHKVIDEYMQKAHENNFIIAGATIGAPNSLYELPFNKPLVLMFGNETRGLSDQAKQQCDMLFEIPMHGMTESLNLSVSAAISMQYIAHKKRELLDKHGDFTEDELMTLKAKYYLKSVEARLVKALFV